MVLNLCSKFARELFVILFLMNAQSLVDGSESVVAVGRSAIDTVAEYCHIFQQEKCIENGVQSDLEIFISNGCIDTDIRSAYMDLQKKRSFKNDLSTECHIES
jgi:hypothetical protein